MPSPQRDMGSPSGSAAATITLAVTGSTAAWFLWSTGHFRHGPQQQPVWGDVRRLRLVTFSALGKVHTAVALHTMTPLRCSVTRDTTIVCTDGSIPSTHWDRQQLGRIHIEALVDTGAGATVTNGKAFAQVPEKDKVRLVINGNQLGLTGAMKHPLDIVGVFKIKMVVPDVCTISPVVIVVRNISLPLILGMDLLQIYGANVDARTMQVTWAPTGANERAEIVLAHQTYPHSVQK